MPTSICHRSSRRQSIGARACSQDATRSQKPQSTNESHWQAQCWQAVADIVFAGRTNPNLWEWARYTLLRCSLSELPRRHQGVLYSYDSRRSLLLLNSSRWTSRKACLRLGWLPLSAAIAEAGGRCSQACRRSCAVRLDLSADATGFYQRSH